MSRCIDQRFEEMLYAYELGILSDGDRVEMEQHLLECDSCAEAAREFQQISQLLRQDETVRHSARELAQAESSSQTVEVLPFEPFRKKKSKYLTPIWMAAAAIFLLLILKDWQFEIKPSQEAIADLRWSNSVAVLPFADLSEEHNQAYFCAGMTDEIITRLAGTRDLKVISRMAVMRYVDTKLDIKAIAGELRVSSVLEGTILREGNNLRINATLTDAREGFQLWSKVFNIEFESIFDVQNEVSKAIAWALQVELAPHVLSKMLTQKRPVMEAYDYFLNGRHYLIDRFVPFQDKEDVLTSIRMFRKAIELDSTYADAYTGAGWAFAYFNEFHRSKRKDSLALDYLQKGFDRDSSSALPIVGKGWVEVRAGNYDAAHLRYRQALELEPNSMIGNRGMADFLKGAGLFYQALTYYEKSAELSPMLIWTKGFQASTQLVLGRIDDAEQTLQKIMDINPKVLMYQCRTAWIAIALGDYGKAEEILIKSDDIWNPDGTKTRLPHSVGITRALLFAARGEKDSVLSLMNSTNLAFGRYKQYYYALLGMEDEAFEHINIMIDLVEKSGGWDLYRIENRYLSLMHNPFLENLRDDPRFAELLERQRLTYERNLTRFGDRHL